MNDRTTDLFEGVWPITQEGVSYNSYLVLGEKKVMIDLAKSTHSSSLLEQISGVIDPSELDYVVINHMEPDHTGATQASQTSCPPGRNSGNSQGCAHDRGLLRHHRRCAGGG